MPGETRGRAGWDLLVSSVAAERRALVIGSTSGLVWTVCKILVPILAGEAVDKGIVTDRHDALLKWTLALVAVGLVQAVTTGLRRYQAFTIAYNVETDLRHRLFAHLQRLHFA
ncbi:MAG TPA: ABC transporter transmembrane domain-containing protein, partial [Acidimicrobiales bacterium]